MLQEFCCKATAAEVREVGSLLYLDWSLVVGGIKKARRVYKRYSLLHSICRLVTSLFLHADCWAASQFLVLYI